MQVNKINYTNNIYSHRAYSPLVYAQRGQNAIINLSQSNYINYKSSNGSISFHSSRFFLPYNYVLKKFLENNISKDVVILSKGGHRMDDDKIDAIRVILTNLK